MNTRYGVAHFESEALFSDDAQDEFHVDEPWRFHIDYASQYADHGLFEARSVWRLNLHRSNVIR